MWGEWGAGGGAFLNLGPTSDGPGPEQAPSQVGVQRRLACIVQSTDICTVRPRGVGVCASVTVQVGLKRSLVTAVKLTWDGDVSTAAGSHGAQKRNAP